MKRVYVDYAASTPIRKEVMRAMAPYFAVKFGNASSLHSFGQEAITAVDKARELVAHEIGAEFREVVFTGSATEANNLALRGAVKQFKETFPSLRPRVIVSAVEHESVLHTARDLEKEGVEVITIPVDAYGVVDVQKIKEALNERVAIVSVMYVNNETGTIQPIASITSLMSHASAHPFPLFHTDAVQAFNYFSCNVKELGVNLMTLSGHKIGGPKGVGVLYVMQSGAKARTHCISPIQMGGGQEFGMRSGTENVPAIVGFTEAMRCASRERKKEYARLIKCKRALWTHIKKCAPDAVIHGMDEARFKEASPHILNVGFARVPVDDLLVRLDMEGVAASSGSACASRAPEHSHVLMAMFQNASRGIRFSFGKGTSTSDIAYVAKKIKVAVARS